MKTIHDINNEHEARLTNLLNECRVFWAFSDKQYEEGKIKIGFRAENKEEKLCRIPGGGFAPSHLADKLIKGMEELSKWKRAEVKRMRDGGKAEILHQLWNHECFYTGDCSDVVNMFKGTYTAKQIIKVYRENREAALSTL